jgi:hypothetical protein
LNPGSFDRGQTNQKNFMTNPAVRNDIHIDRVSSAAICEEMGDRLRIGLKGGPERIPQHIRTLVEQIALNDGVSALTRRQKQN